MPHSSLLKRLLSQRLGAPLARLSAEHPLAQAGLSRVDRVAFAACVAGGGSGAAVVLSKLFCLQVGF
jgi:hypothetical protein